MSSHRWPNMSRVLTIPSSCCLLKETRSARNLHRHGYRSYQVLKEMRQLFNDHLCIKRGDGEAFCFKVVNQKDINIKYLLGCVQKVQDCTGMPLFTAMSSCYVAMPQGKLSYKLASQMAKWPHVKHTLLPTRSPLWEVTRTTGPDRGAW